MASVSVSGLAEICTILTFAINQLGSIPKNFSLTWIQVILSKIVMNTNQKNIEKGANILQEHDQWLAENLDQLIEKYPGKIVAVLDGEIVAVGDTYKEVYEPFQNQNRDWMPLAIRVPYPDELHELLI